MLFSHVKISSFRAKARLVFHWCLYNSYIFHYHMHFIRIIFTILTSLFSSFLSFRMESNFEPDSRNSSFSDKDPLGRTPLQVGIEVTIAVLICLACIAGNVTVVIAIHKTPRLKTVTNMLVENLAWTDISMATLHLPFWIMSMSSGRWLLSHVACKIVGFSELVFGVASLQTMAGIALNRYFSIVRRNVFMKYFSDRKATLKIIIVSWVLPVVVCSPPLYGWGTIEFSDKFTDCTMGWSIPDISYISFLLSVSIVIPMMVIICCYFAIFRFVKKKLSSDSKPLTGRKSQTTEEQCTVNQKRNESYQGFCCRCFCVRFLLDTSLYCRYL